LKSNEETQFPSVITIFSAPNYLDTYQNSAAILKYENNVFNIRQFKQTTHPYYLPGFINAFSWSLPFVAEKVGDFFDNVVNLVDDEEEDGKVTKREALREKIRTIGRMYHIYQQKRREREQSVQIGGISPKNGTLPPTVKRTTSDEDIKKCLSSFDGIKSLDEPNEARPPNVEEFVHQQKFSTPSQKLVRTRSMELLMKQQLLQDIDKNL